MLNNELHLFVLEGHGAEPKYLDQLERNFFGRRISLKCVFDAEIYQLYEQLKTEEFAVDIVNVLKERNPKNAEILKEFKRDSFAGIYLSLTMTHMPLWLMMTKSVRCLNILTMKQKMVVSI